MLSPRYVNWAVYEPVFKLTSRLAWPLASVVLVYVTPFKRMETCLEANGFPSDVSLNVTVVVNVLYPVTSDAVI